MTHRLVFQHHRRFIVRSSHHHRGFIFQSSGVYCPLLCWLTIDSPFHHHHHHPTALLLSSSSSFSSSSPCCLALVIIGRFCFHYTLLLSICYHRKGLFALHLAAQHLLLLGGVFCTSMLSICYYAASFYYHQAVLSINDLFLYSSVSLVLSYLLSCRVSCLVVSLVFAFV